MLDSVVAYVIVRAASWDLQTAMRWLTGSLNGATWDQVLPLALAAVVVRAGAARAEPRSRPLMQLGDEAAVALGVRVERTRVLTHRRGGRADRVRHRGRRPDRVRGLPQRADRRPDRRARAGR